MDLEDFIVSNNLLPLGSLVYLLFCTSRYGWGFKNFLAEADEGKGIKFRRGREFTFPTESRLSCWLSLFRLLVKVCTDVYELKK